MAVFISDFDSEDVITIQESETTIKNTKASEAFDAMFEESNKALNTMLAELWRAKA